MTYAAHETSEQSGAPVELYLFTRNAVDGSDPCSPVSSSTVLVRSTSAEVDIEHDSETWVSDVLSRSDLEESPELARVPISITTRRNNPVADLFRVSPPTDVIALTIFRLHRDDSPAEAVVLWMGRVLNCEWTGAQARLNCEPVSTSVRRTGLRRLYQKGCPHVLYGAGCKVDRTAHDIATTVTAIDGKVLSVAALLDRPYAGGYVQRETSSGVFEKRFIQAQDGLDLTLSLPFSGLDVSDAVTVFPGCDHTTATCNDVYSNLPNYGGMPFIPSKNPFGGDPVY